ncbi:hypothetical protein MIMGU_mgv1a023909mg, partial [Erythranthe guttata]
SVELVKPSCVGFPQTKHKRYNMGLSGKLVSKTNIKSDGDVFHEIFRERPHHVPDMSPDEWGTVHGKECVAKDIIEAIDEEKKSVTFNIVEGDLMELYKTFKLTAHVDTTGEDNVDVPDPHTLMDLCVKMTKDIESHHLINA